MNRLAALLLCVCLNAPVARAESLRTFDDVLAALDIPMQAGDLDGAASLLSKALRDARVGGWLRPEWAIFYAMQADFARLEYGNPAYALQLTESGLELIAGDPAQDDFAAALRISGAYALADLGRFAEAAETARLALPQFRLVFGDAEADDLAARADDWAAGRLTDFNTAATELARKTMEKAYAASAGGAPGQAIALAASAILPLGTDLPETEVRGIGFEAEIMIADSLIVLGRLPESVAASRRGLDYLMVSPWQPPAPAEWGVLDTDDASRRVVFAALTNLATRAPAAGEHDLAKAVLREAKRFASNGDDRMLLILLQASLSFRGGDSAGALDLIAETRAEAEAAGDQSLVLMSEFYDAVVRARDAQFAERPINPAPLIARAEAALAYGVENGGIDRQLVLSDASQVLARTESTGSGLAWAREALQARRDELAGRDDTAYADTQARLNARGLIETFLKSAHDAAGGVDPSRGAACPPTPGFYSCVVAVRRD